MRVNLSSLNIQNWHHFLRQRDLLQILINLDYDKNKRVLEVGAGDGSQTKLLKEYFNEVVSIDIAPATNIQHIIIADVCDLPFEDKEFDIIFSSNVLEHVDDLEKAFSEMKRVLKDNGMMIHSMPSHVWKLLQISLGWLHSLKKIMYKLLNIKISRRATPDDFVHLHGTKSKKRGLRDKLMGLIIPSIHGTSSNHIYEYLRFRPSYWEKKFKENDLICIKKHNLFLHTPYEFFPFKFLRLRDLIGKWGFASVFAYELRKIR